MCYNNFLTSYTLLMNTEQNKLLTQAADIIFENYKFKAVLHIMSGWHVNEQQRTLHKDISVSVPQEDKFLDAEFFLQYDEHFNITACYPKQKKYDIGEHLKFSPPILTEAI